MSLSSENEQYFGQAIRMAGLIDKVREKEPLKEEERQELNEWLNNDESNKQLFDFLQNREQLTAELEALMQYDENVAVSAIFKQLEQPLPSFKKGSRIIWRLSLAASLLLFISAALWFVIWKGRPVINKTPLTVNINPGTNSAILTLANGNQVMLGSIQNLQLDRQGAAQVELQQGRLVYTSAGIGPVVYNTITTPRGCQFNLLLADGSEIWLNAASSIAYPSSFAGNTRNVTITSGEAYFKVAKDKAKPFVVMARSMQAQVLGTEFNVMAYKDEDATSITLLEGSVKVQPALAQPGANFQSTILEPGEQVSVSQTSQLSKPIAVKTDDIIAWRFGQFHFHETDIPAIMRQIARWYNISVEYRGSVANINFSGQISRKGRVKELLDILSDTRKVHFELKDHNTIVVIPGPK